MARFWSTVVFFPTALRRGTQRNTIQLKTCTRTTQTFFCTVEKTEMKDCLIAARLSSPRMNVGAFRRDLVTDLFFRPLFEFFIIELQSRKVIHVGVTRAPLCGSGQRRGLRRCP